MKLHLPLLLRKALLVLYSVTLSAGFKTLASSYTIDKGSETTRVDSFEISGVLDGGDLLQTEGVSCKAATISGGDFHGNVTNITNSTLQLSKSIVLTCYASGGSIMNSCAVSPTVGFTQFGHIDDLTVTCTTFYLSMSDSVKNLTLNMQPPNSAASIGNVNTLEGVRASGNTTSGANASLSFSNVKNCTDVNLTNLMTSFYYEGVVTNFSLSDGHGFYSAYGTKFKGDFRVIGNKPEAAQENSSKPLLVVLDSNGFLDGATGFISDCSVYMHSNISKGAASLLSLDEKGFWIQNNDIISIGGNDDAYYNKQFAYIVESKGNLNILNNKQVAISGNSLAAGKNAAAIFVSPSTGGTANLYIRGNEQVEISSNLVESGEIIPYSIMSTSGNVFLDTMPQNQSTLSTADSAASSYIKLYQPIYVAGSLALNYNKGVGEILISGEHIDSYMAKQGSKNAKNEIREKNRTSLVMGNVDLQSGSLTIADTAILKIANKSQSSQSESENNRFSMLSIRDGATLSVEYAGISTDGTKYESVPALSVGYLNLDNDSNMEIYTSSNIGELKTPIIKLSDYLSINDDVALTVVNTGNDFKSGELRPLLEVPMVALGKQGANGGVIAYGFASKIKGAPIMEHISWTSVNESSKTQGFSYRSEKGTLDEKVELTWVNDILYIKSKEDGFWLKNTNETRSNLLDSDKTFDSDGEVEDEIDASGKIVSDMSCYVHVAKNLIDVFQSRGGYLLSANNSILPATDITNLKKIFRYKAGVAGSWKTVVNYYFSGANAGAVTFHRKGQSGLFKVQADVFREVNNEFPAPVKDIMTLTEQMKPRLERGFSPIALSFGTSPTEKITEGNTTIYKYKEPGHVVTCWGYEEFTTPVTSDKYLVLYVTDSDTEPHNGKAYSEIWCEQDDTGLKIVHYNGLNPSQENFYIRDIGSVTTTSTTLDEARRLYESTSNAMIRTGESGVWTATSLSDSLSGTSIPADWVKYVGDNTWVKADFYDDSVENPAEDTIAFAESETSFRFVDSIDGVSLPYEHRDITLIGDLGVQKVTIEGDNYVFGGTGSLTSTDVTVTGSLALDETVQIRHTPISINGGLLNAYVKDQITIEGGSIQLSSNGTLHCAGFAYEQGEYLLTSCSLQAVNVHSDGSGVLQATMDFGGQSIELSTINALSDNEELNKLFHASVNAVDGIDSFTYRYEAANADIEATAASLSQQHIGLKTCFLSINADDTDQVTIGSYFASVDESAASVSLSEQDGGTIKSGQTKLSTVQGERVYFHSAVNVETSQLTVSQNSSLMNDGLIVGENAAAGIVVESQAQLGGCGHFSSTLVKSGGVLRVGEGLGNPVYDSLIMQSGSCLIFGVDGMSPASSVKRGWGSGAHSVLTVNGNFSIQEGVTVQVGCSLDFLNASSLGNTHTLTLIQMANAASEDVLQTLMTGTEFLWADYDTLAAISEVGASIHDYAWHMGENNEIQLSFVVSSCPAESLRWSADAPSQVWDEVSRNWVDASGNQLAYERGKPVLFYDGATVEIRGEHVPEKVIVSSSEDVTFIGSGNIGGKCELIKEGSGELTINTENAYSGGTSIIGGRLVAANSNALGAGGVIIRNAALNIAADGIENAIITEGEAWLTVENNNTLVLSNSILNDGTLTLKGTLDVSSLVGEIESTGNTRVDINGNAGASGFASSTEISVAVVDGGSIVDDGVEILAHGMVLTLGADGIASNGGGTNYAEYLVTGSHEVSARAVHEASKGALRQITLNDGVLNADASVQVEATGGEINLSAGTLSGTISGTALNVSGGELTAQLSGSNTLTASDWTMQQSIANTGNLTLTGTLDASSLQKHLTGVDVRVDENGNAGGQSGFLRTGDFTVTVAGGTVDSTGATVSYGGQTLSMNGGTGSGLGEVQLGTYLLTGNDAATVSKIQAKAGNALQKIDMQGGTLNVDASTNALVATAGQVNLSAGTLGGSLGGSAAVVVSGTAIITGTNSYSGGTSLSNAQLTIKDAAALGSGSITTSGSSSLVVEGATLKLGSVIANSGNLSLSGSYDASALAKVVGAVTYVDATGMETAAGSGFTHEGDFTVTIAEGTVNSSAAKVTYQGVVLSMDGGVGSGAGTTDFSTYRILDGHEVSVSAVKAASKDALQQITQGGGVLNADASVQVEATGGEINLSEGTLSGTISGTALNVSGGVLTAQLSGSNTLTASDWAMQQSIANTGNLTLTGTLDASALQKQLTGVDVRVDENGNAGGQSGFLRTGDFTVTVAGGTVDSSGATVSYGGQTLSMNGGTGSGLGEVQLGTYLLTGNDAATVSKIQAKAGSALQKIDMQGGTLNVDASTDALVATAGQVNLSAGTLGGSLGGSAAVAVSGTAIITGTNSYSGGTSLANAQLTITDAAALGTGSITTSGTSSLVVEGVTLELGSVIANSGNLSLSGSYDASALDMVSGADTYLDVQGNVTADGSGFTHMGDFTVTIAEGTVDSTAARVMYMGTELSMEGGVGRGTSLTDFRIYRILDGHEVSVSAVKAASKDALQQITQGGGVLNADASVQVEATGGEINLSAGTLSGSISGTALNVSGGALTAQLSGSNTLTASDWAMQQSIANTGNLTLTGTLDASALQKQLTGVDVRVDENGSAGGQSGFLRTGDFTVTVAGGTVDSTGATVSYGGQTLSMNGGTGSGLGEVQLGTYLLTGNDAATVSKIQAKAGSALQKIDMQGGTLNVDASTDALVATAGQVNLSAGTLGGSLGGSAAVAVSGTATITGTNSYSGGTSLSNAQLTITDAAALGTGSITTSGTSSLIIENVALKLGSAIANEGSLSLSGCIDASNLELERLDEGRLSLEGREVSLSESGFARAAAYHVALVKGGSIVNDGVVVLHDEYLTRARLELGNDGVARAGGGVDYRQYFLTGADEVKVSDIAAVSSQNQATLDGVSMDSGTLTVDQSMAVMSGGGNIHITDDAVLSGSISQTAVTTAAGDYTGDITASLAGDTTLVVNGGHITVSGANSYTGGTTVNGGTLQAGHRAAFGAGEVTVNDATLDLNNFTIANKVLLNGKSTLEHASGASNLVLGKGASVNIRGGHTLGSGETLEVAASGAVYTGALTLGGGILDLDGKLTVEGDVTFESGKQTTLDLSGWTGADDGEVLAEFGGSCSGYTEDCLKLSGIDGFWNLEFDPLSGTLTLAAVRDASLLNLNRNQTAVYNTILNYGTPTGLLGELAKEMMDSRDEAQIKQMLDEMGGAEYATLMSGQQAAASGHMRRLRGEMGSGHQLAGSKTRAYIEAYNHRSELDADASGRGYELSESGGQFALEFIGEAHTSGGFAVAAGRSKLQPDGGLTQKSDNTYVDAFVLHRDGSYTGKFSLGVGVHKYDLERRVAGNPVEADTDGSSVNFMHESAWAVSLAESHSVQVFGAVESSFNKLGAFHEKGADTASLQVESQDAWVTTLSVSARYLYSFDAVNSAPAATLSVQGGLEVDFGDTESEVEMNFEGARGHSFRQSGAERDTFGYNLGASLHLPVSTKAAIYASGDAVLRGNSYEVNANVGLQMAF